MPVCDNRGLQMLKIPGDSGGYQVNLLEKQLGINWAAIRKARTTTIEKQSSLRKAFEEEISSDTTLVMFGSIARLEMTSGSDSDWIILLTGKQSLSIQSLCTTL